MQQFCGTDSAPVDIKTWMFNFFRSICNLPDRLDLGGWLLVISGVLIIGVTTLTPAWLQVRELEIQQQQLAHTASQLELYHQNYEAVLRAIERSDPLIMQRLAWHHLKESPRGEILVSTEYIDRYAPAPTIDDWVRPASINLPPTSSTTPAPLADTKLTRLISGPTRPWVLAFGGWLVLMGLVLNPSNKIESI